MPLPCRSNLSLTGSAKYFSNDINVWTFVQHIKHYKTTSSNTFERSKTCREALASASLNISFNIVALADSVRLETAVIYSPMVDFVLACIKLYATVYTGGIQSIL